MVDKHYDWVGPWLSDDKCSQYDECKKENIICEEDHHKTCIFYQGRAHQTLYDLQRKLKKQAKHKVLSNSIYNTEDK